MIRKTVLALALISVGCAHTYGADISALQPEGSPAFTDPEQEEARAIVVEIGRAAGFLDVRTAPEQWKPAPSDRYQYFVVLNGEDFEQATVSIAGRMRSDRREIRVSIGDAHRGEPLPATQKLVGDLRSALERAFPEARVEVTERSKLRTFAP